MKPGSNYGQVFILFFIYIYLEAENFFIIKDY